MVRMFEYRIRDILKAKSKLTDKYSETFLSKPLIGSIFYIDLGKPMGSIQGGLRPCVIYNNFEIDPDITVSTFFPLTTKLKKLHLPVHVIIKSTTTNGLKADSMVLIEQIGHIENSKLLKPLGMLTCEEFLKIRAGVNIQFPFTQSIPDNLKQNELDDIKKYFEAVFSTINK